MSAGLQIIIPGYRTYGYGIEFAHLYRIVRQEQIEREPKFIIENVKFEHDEEWRNRFLSIQSVHDGNHPVWATTHILVRFLYPASSAIPWWSIL